MNNNINLWFAKNENGEIVTINKINEEYEGKYYCPLCGSEVIPKAIDSNKISAHFAHIDRSKCSGESFLHYWCKTELIKAGDVFEVITDTSRQHMCKEVLFEQSYDTPHGIYKPDITVVTYKDEKIFIEVNYTNKKNSEDYYLKWKHLGCVVVEFGIRNIYNEENNKVSIEKMFKAIYYDGIEIIFEKEDYNLFRDRIIQEIKSADINTINELKWFIDDVYRFSKGYSDDIHELSNNLIEISKDLKNKQVLVCLYKNNKCQTVMKDILNYIPEYISKKLKNMYDDENIEVDVITDKSLDNRLILDRIFGKNITSIKISKKEELVIDENKTKLDAMHEYTDYENVITRYNFYKILGMRELDGISDFKVEYALKDLQNFDNIDSYVNHVNDKAAKCIEKIVKAKSTDVITGNASENIDNIKNNYLVDATVAINHLRDNFSVNEYDTIQNKYISDDLVSFNKIFSDILYTCKTTEIEGVSFYIFNDLNMPTIKDKIEIVVSNHEAKYSDNIKICELLSSSSKLSNISCTIDGVYFRYNGRYFSVKDLCVMHNDIKLGFISEYNEKTADYIISLIDSLIVESNYDNDKANSIFTKIKNTYYKVDGYYKVCNSVKGLSLYKTDKYGNKLYMISYIDYKDDTTYECVLSKFSDDLRGFLYGGRS